MDAVSRDHSNNWRHVLIFNTIEQSETAEKETNAWAQIGNERWCSCQEKTVFLSSNVFVSTVVLHRWSTTWSTSKEDKWHAYMCGGRSWNARKQGPLTAIPVTPELCRQVIDITWQRMWLCVESSGRHFGHRLWAHFCVPSVIQHLTDVWCIMSWCVQYCLLLTCRWFTA